MVLPEDQLMVKIHHIGMCDGNMVVKVEMFNEHDEKIIDGNAKVAQPTTIYVFTGQGLQEAGMGMDLYNLSPVAHAVWDGADAHLCVVYGFSIIEIIKDNQKVKTIHFGGIKGQTIHQQYMDMSHDMMDKDGNVKTLPLSTSRHSNILSITPMACFLPPNFNLLKLCLSSWRRLPLKICGPKALYK